MMISQEFQTDKLVPIDLPEICAPRLELLSKFDKASRKRYLYISAPAGCGKTVSTLLWIRKTGYKIIWLGLDIYDNTLAAFYRFFCTALFSVIPQEESLAKIVKDTAFNASPVEYTIEVLSRLSFDGCDYALVFDDFHHITNEEIVKSLLYVIKRLPFSVKVLILSRLPLPQAFSPLADSGKIAFIGAPELAFKSDEIRSHFASFGRFITTKEADGAFSITEGWAIAVSALVLSGNIAADEKFKSNPLGKYIKTQIWDKIDEGLRRFMLQTSIVDELSAELCEQITKNPKSSQILEMLCSENMFISRQNGVYRYHHLFLDFLRGEAAAEAAEHKVLYQRAANYYSNAGDHFSALRYYIMCGDSKGAAVALHNFMIFSGQSSSEMSKISFIHELPADFLEKNPFLYVGCAWWALLFSDAKNLFFYLDRLYERIRDITSEYKAFLESALLLFTVDPRYSFAEQMAKFQTGIVLEVENQNIPKSLNHNLPYFHRTYRDYSHYALNTEAHFAEFRHVFFALLGVDYALIESGVKSGLLYEKNLLKDALALMEPNPVTDSPELVFLSKMQIAFILYAMGKVDEEARCRDEIKSFLEKGRLLYLMPVFSAYETKLNLMNGNKAAAVSWLDSYFVTESQSPQLHKIFLHFTTVRAYIVLGEFEKAQKLCVELGKLSKDFYRLLDLTEASVLLAVLMWLTGKKQEASALLQTTLADMEPYHFVRVFADEGKTILPVMKKLLKKADKKDEPCMPGFRYLQEVYLAAYEQSKRYKGIACTAGLKPVRLSRQQKYVLELLAKGYKNAEIVELTGLSLNTIRAHTKVAYQKLEVNNAMDAILRARELGLINQ